MTERLDLPRRYREQIEALLREHVPGVEVWAYGSRVNGRSHEGSDLDLVLRGPDLQRIPSGQRMDLTEALEASNVPIIVQVHDWAGLPERFHREIEREYVALVGEEVQLRYVAELVMGQSPPGSTYNEIGDGLPFFQGVKDFNYRHPSPRVFCSAPSRIAQPGDILFSVRAPIGRVNIADRECATGRGLAIIKPRIQSDARYLEFLLRHIEPNWNVIEGSGSVFGNATKKDLETLHLWWPDKSKRNAIAHILGTLDDKIELNRRMNETLEEMARALFKSWFVDFDPVRAKAALKPPHNIPPPLGGRQRAAGAPVGAIRRQYTRRTLQRARALRQAQTDAESLLWHYLRGKQLGGYKFRRQQPIGPYIADFVCLSQKLLIEVDGGYHARRKDYDERRDRFLRDEGYRVLRFWNNEVFEDCFGVLERVYAALEAPAPPPPPEAATPPKGGVGRWNVLVRISTRWSRALRRCFPIILSIRNWGRYRRGGRLAF